MSEKTGDFSRFVQIRDNRGALTADIAPKWGNCDTNRTLPPSWDKKPWFAGCGGRLQKAGSAGAGRLWDSLCRLFSAVKEYRQPNGRFLRGCRLHPMLVMRRN